VPAIGIVPAEEPQNLGVIGAEHIGITFPSDVQLVGDSGAVVSALVAALGDKPNHLLCRQPRLSPPVC